MFNRKKWQKAYLKRWRKKNPEKQHPKGYKPVRKVILGVTVDWSYLHGKV